MRTIDTRGQQCPAPLIATKRALKETKKGDSFKVLTDNKTSLENISRFLKDNKTEFSVEEAAGVWTITVTKISVNVTLNNAENYCTTEVPHFSQGDFIIVFSSDKMGEGDSELGHLLMANFIKAIKDLEILPKKMVFYNNGVKLGTVDSPVFEHLREIEKMGVGLFLCATCAKYYSLEEKIKVGSLSNMYEIAQVMASASNILKP
ncbi:MAG: sulfurtransferase-like selenium metabolism protein YedF [Bacteroidia bacterium]|nr:sulfurtransferase-like selenium metabolism protein YedF [Bacteroidia bacterium]